MWLITKPVLDFLKSIQPFGYLFSAELQSQYGLPAATFRATQTLLVPDTWGGPHESSRWSIVIPLEGFLQHLGSCLFGGMARLIPWRSSSFSLGASTTAAPAPTAQACSCHWCLECLNPAWAICQGNCQAWSTSLAILWPTFGRSWRGEPTRAASPISPVLDEISFWFFLETFRGC